jgi:hypothetical protein
MPYVYESLRICFVLFSEIKKKKFLLPNNFGFKTTKDLNQWIITATDVINANIRIDNSAQS